MDTTRARSDLLVVFGRGSRCATTPHAVRVQGYQRRTREYEQDLKHMQRYWLEEQLPQVEWTAGAEWTKLSVFLL
jgi:hypothetical protein